jgi:hypothetical protein
MPDQAPTEAAPAAKAVTGWEYTSNSCEQWQIHHLCNYFARFGWEPVQVWPIDPESVQLPASVEDENGPLRPAHRPVMALFRRPDDYSREDDDA